MPAASVHTVGLKADAVLQASAHAAAEILCEVVCVRLGLRQGPCLYLIVSWCLLLRRHIIAFVCNIILCSVSLIAGVAIDRIPSLGRTRFEEHETHNPQYI